MLRALVISALWLLAATARANDDGETRARAHFEIGSGLYRLGDFRGAAREFAIGYELAHRPRFLLNMGQSYRQLGDRRQAYALYRQFLAEAAADDPARPQVKAILTELEPTRGDRPPLPERDTAPERPPAGEPASTSGPKTTSPTVVPATRPPERARSDSAGLARSRLRITGLTLGAIGLAGLGGGVTFTLLADNAARSLNALDRSGGVFDPAQDTMFRTNQTLAIGFFVGGGAVLATGVVLYIVGRR
jgi:hypothetical protein